MGTVDTITMLKTYLKSPDGKEILVPNTKIFGDNIINYSAPPCRRIDMVIGVGYGDDLLKAKEVLTAVLAEDPRVLSDPPARVDVMELADSSVNFAVRPWVKSSDFWGAKCELTEKIKLRLDQEGISIPFPQRDVHIFQETEGTA